MNKLWIATFIVLVSAAGPALAQKGDPPEPAGMGESRPATVRVTPPASYPVLSPGELKATPEMWFYEQSLRQHQDPKVAVRRAAEVRADQRQRRINSMKWFGLSNSRPRANVDPVDTAYSAGWSSNNDFYPERWNASAGPVIAVRPDSRAY